MEIVQEYVSEKTSIEVKDETWKRLNRRKERGDSFDDVINKLLSQTNAQEM